MPLSNIIFINNKAFRLTPILFMMFYIYGVIGMEIFNTATFEYKTDSPYSENSYADFNSLGSAMLILF